VTQFQIELSTGFQIFLETIAAGLILFMQHIRKVKRSYADFVQSTNGSFMLASQSTRPNAFGKKEVIILKVYAREYLILYSRINSAHVNSFNNDRRNDVYKPTLHGTIVKFHLIIYNRFGEKVYESYDINNEWNGPFNNVKK
jgi:CHU_C Type IX secretion signal domain